ncbi:MAG: N-methyl-L-tryptophan oxidase [Gemmatimonadaceae bacterium]
MPEVHDVVIAGLGATGSSAAYELALRGARVIGFDLFRPPHTVGSTHGRTRIIREAYFEHPLYVPLIQRAYERWYELERDAGRELFVQTGGLMIGRPNSTLVAGARESAERHGLEFELLTGEELIRRFPPFAPDADVVGLFEPRAGLLLPEACVESFLDLARGRGATLKLDEPIVRWTATADGVEVVTERGTYSAGRLLIAAGPWIGSLLPELALPLTVERQLVHWFRPAGMERELRADRCPIALWELPRADDQQGFMFAIFPDLGNGVKIGIHHEGEATDPANIRREITAAEDDAVRALLARYLPAAAGEIIERRVCMYTNTPDQHFLIDVHPAHPQVLIASPCSGHGFKFASAVGEILADLLTDRRPRFDLTPFSMQRFRRPG